MRTQRIEAMVEAKVVADLLRRHGTVQSQPTSDWTGPFPLPKAVAGFYDSVGPVNIDIESYGNGFYLPRLADLWDFQKGYRYHPSTHARFPDWRDDWLVVAYQGGDAFIQSIRSGQVLFALHGAGIWRPHVVFPDIFAMAACLATLGNVVADAGRDFTAADCTIRPKHLKEVVERLGRFLPSDDEVQTLLTDVGWQ